MSGLSYLSLCGPSLARIGATILTLQFTCWATSVSFYNYLTDKYQHDKIDHIDSVNYIRLSLILSGGGSGPKKPRQPHISYRNMEM